MKTIDILKLINETINTIFEIDDILINLNRDGTINENYRYPIIVGKGEFDETDVAAFGDIYQKIGNVKTYDRDKMTQYLLTKYPETMDVKDIIEAIEMQIEL